MNLLFDIGGTRMRFGLSNKNGEILNFQIFDSINNFEKLIDIIKEKKEVITESNNIENLCGGIAGVVKDNKLMFSPNLGELVNKDLEREMLKLFKADNFFLLNDSALEGLGEAVSGAGRSHNIVAYISIGTGVGGARIVDKMFDESNFGFEPGHQIINFDDNSYLTLENLISGASIIKSTGMRASQIVDKNFWNKKEKILAFGLNNISLHWSPDVIVLGGGIIKSNKISIHNVQNILNSILDVYPKNPKLKKFELEDMAGLVGANYYLNMQL